MKFDSFYFLHMQKCDGRRFIDTVLTPLLEENKNLINLSNPMAHQGWDHRITDKTYVFTILRDPVERVVSHYVYIMSYRIKRMKAKTVKDSLSTSTKLEETYLKFYFNKEYFLEYVKNAINFHNFYSKMFLGDLSKEKNLLHKNEFLLKKENIDLIFKNINRVNLLIDIETFRTIDKKILTNKICDDIGCSYSIPNDEFFEEWTGYTNEASRILYNELTEDDKNYLKQYLSIDYKIYDSKDLFWKPSI